MSRIRVTFDKRSREAWATPVPVEVLNERLVSVANEVMLLGDSRSIEVGEPGLYHVRAEFPTGETVATTVSVQEKDLDTLAMLTASEGSPRESLAWAYTQQSVRRTVGERSTAAFAELPETSSWRRKLRGRPFFSPAGGPPAVNFTGIFHIVPKATGWRFVRFTNRREWDTSVSESDPRLIAELRLFTAGKTPVFIRMHPVGRRKRQEVTFVSVPTSYNPRVLFLRDAGTGAIRTLVTGARPQGEALLAYLESGAVGAARRVGPSIVEDAAEALRKKRDDPFGASIAGYFLLSAKKLGRQDWMKNLADWFPTLADGAVIYAVSLLREEGAERRADAREYLLEAVRRGLPTYTIGLRFLFDSLQYLARDETDEPVAAALARVRFVAAYADWDAQTTTLSIPINAENSFIRF